MKDLEVRLDHRPGALATFAVTLGEAHVSLEGGGVFVTGGVGVAHFLVADDDVPAARTALRAAGVEVVGAHVVALTRLRQDVPGQLGALCSRLAAAGVDVLTQYSDHDGRLVLVVDDPAAAGPVLDAWNHASV